MSDKGLKELDLNFDFIEKPGAECTLVFLHGFTGSLRDWDDVIPGITAECNILAVNLIGHGASPAPADEVYYNISKQTGYLKSLFSDLQLDNIVLYGYSMGGRIALSYALEYPANIKGLILESSSPGIDDPKESAERYKKDSAIAEMIKDKGIENFVNYWMDLPIFAGLTVLPGKEYDKLKRRKLNNNPDGLANTIKVMSPGRVPSKWKRLPELKMPLLVMAGEKDEKYKTINERMSETIKIIENVIIDNAGHNIHAVRPASVIEEINRFLEKLNKVQDGI